LLSAAELFAYPSLDSGTVYGAFGAFTANYQAQSGLRLGIACYQKQVTAQANLPFRLIKDGLILGTGKEAMLAGKGL